MAMRLQFKRLQGIFLTAILLTGSKTAHGEEEFIVHEWGTITTRHAPDGTPAGRLNKIAPSEVLPPFVHRFEPPESASNAEGGFSKRPLTPGHPDVTMRLETPVIYFYPPASFNPKTRIDVRVKFHGGIINEFYPTADPSVALDFSRVQTKMRAGIVKTWDGNVLNNYVVGSLAWSSLTLYEGSDFPKTAAEVWQAPRRVRAIGARTPNGEREKYLFYRGVAHLEALLQTRLADTKLNVLAPRRLHWLAEEKMVLENVWIADIQSDGTVEFKEYRGITIRKKPSEELFQHTFSEGKPVEIALLKQAMLTGLEAQGLYRDEAQAMLATWDAAYFGTPGKRIFYTVPEEWITNFLPLSISIPHKLTRVLIGRIDLNA